MNHHLGEDTLAFVRGELSEQQLQKMRAHLSECSECREAVRHVQRAHSALAAWPQNPVLPESLADAIRTSVPHAAPRRSWPAILLRVAALGILIVASGGLGFRLGSTRAAAGNVSAADSLPSFLLLMEEERWPRSSAEPSRSGYGEWAGAIRQTGHFVGGEKLTDEPGWRVRADGSVARPAESERPPNVSGWFLVRARDYNAAIDWVRRGPHLRYGTVLVRQVE